MTKIENSKLKYDSPLFLVVLILVVFGVVMVYSASSFKAQEYFNDSHHFLLNHIIRVTVGFTAMFVAMKIDYHIWLKISPLLLLLTFGTLIFLLVGPNVEKIRGSLRWITMGKFQFQPSDFARLALILFLSSSLGKEEFKIRSPQKSFIIYMSIIALIAIPVLLQPDVGTAALIIFIAVILLFLAGIKLRYLFLLGFTSIPLFTTYLMHDGYQKSRIVEFLSSIQGKKLVWQIQQSLIALGNGGIFGLGLGGSKQKYHFLPDPFTDFIFAIIGEEFGVIGTVLILFLFTVLIRRGFKIAQNAPDTQGKLLAVGVVLNIAVYAFTNAGVVVNLLPITGIPMPFLSFGGTALMVNLFGVGLLLNISAKIWEKHNLYPNSNFYNRRNTTRKYGLASEY